MSNDVILRVDDLSLYYGEFAAVYGANLTIRRGVSTAILGPSGSGKSSLLYCMSGLERPSKGAVFLSHESIWELNDAKRARLRLENFGFVFQSADLIPELTLRDNVALPGELTGSRRRSALRRADMLLERLGVQKERHRRPSDVSGGQRQRAAVARAVMTGPSVIFADEPTGALDSTNRDAVLALLLNLVRDSSAALVMVTHDTSIAAQLDESVCIYDGVVN